MGKAKPKFWHNPRLNSNLLSRKLMGTRRQLDFLQRANIVSSSFDCPSCGWKIEKINYNLKRWKCPKCSHGVSVFTGTFMSGQHLSPRKMLQLGNWLYSVESVVITYISLFSAYYFSQHRRVTQETIVHEIGTSEDESSDDGSDHLSGEYVSEDSPPTLLSRTTIRLLNHWNLEKILE